MTGQVHHHRSHHGYLSLHVDDRGLSLDQSGFEVVFHRYSSIGSVRTADVARPAGVRPFAGRGVAFPGIA